MEKKNTGLIVLVVVLSLLVVGLGGYIVYDKMLDKNINDSDNKCKNDNIIDKNDKNEVAKINETIVVDINNDKTYNKDINNHNVYVDERTLKIDNKVFCELDDINYLYQVSFYDDVIITYQSVGTSGSFVIYDYNGNAVKKIEKFKDDENRLFYTYLRYSDDNVFDVSSEGKISFVGTKHLQGAAGTYLTDDDKVINLLVDDNNIADSDIVSGIFEFSYLGNNNFSDIKFVDSRSTVKDLKK